MIEIDLNADVGEGFEGDDEVLDVVTSCSIACGGHAGDHVTMVETVRLAIAKHIVVGAHPGYPDRENFGRKRGFLEGDALYDSLATQLAAFPGNLRLSAKCEVISGRSNSMSSH